MRDRALKRYRGTSREPSMQDEFDRLLVEALPRLRAYAILLTKNRASADEFRSGCWHNRASLGRRRSQRAKGTPEAQGRSKGG